jgi:putative DNA primase/helicase
MSAAEIAERLGGCRAGSGWWLCPCPAHSDSSPSLGLKDGDRGLIVKCFAGCKREAVLAKLGDPGSPPDPEELARQRATDERAAARRTAVARDIWRTSTVANEASLVAIYLATRQILMLVPASLRLQGPLGPYGEHKPSGARRPQMIAAVQHVDRGGVVAVHRTFLAADGYGKAAVEPQRMILGPARGGAVRLAPLAEKLMVGEGIETCLSAMEATGIGTWAALSTSGLKALVLPPVVREVIILADNDAAGIGAAEAAARRWYAEGRRVRIALPPKAGADFNDLLRGAA